MGICSCFGADSAHVDAVGVAVVVVNARALADAAIPSILSLCITSYFNSYHMHEMICATATASNLSGSEDDLKARQGRLSKAFVAVLPELRDEIQKKM